MGYKSTVEWTQATWNPWAGCSKVSPGCDRCYAEAIMHRWRRDFAVVTRASHNSFYGPLSWKRPRLVFTCSMSDFFHKQADRWRAEAWAIMEVTPQHTYQVLTKRPWLAVAWYKTYGWLPNVWLGTSVESQKYAPRIDVLARVPALVRFVSAEPLLGPLDLMSYFYSCGCNVIPCVCKGVAVHQVIVGGESGPGARPMDLDWARSLRDECQKVGGAFFLKQLGGFPDKRGGLKATLDGQLWHEIPRVQRGG